MKPFIFIALLLSLHLVSFSQTDEKQIVFRGITVDDGLSQNSVIDIAQDSLGYMWFATQDGLNKYDGRTFKHYDYQFDDITRKTYSKLGKIYVDRKGDLWIITSSGILQKYHPTEDTFSKVQNIHNANVIYHSSLNNYWIGTFGNGLYKINPSNQDTIQLLNSNDKLLDINAILEFDKKIIVAISNKVLEFEDRTYKEIPIESSLKVNFSSITKSSKNIVFLGSYGQGLFLKRASENSFKMFVGFDGIEFPNNLIIQDLQFDSSNRLWIATYGQGVYLIDFDHKRIKHIVANKRNPFGLHYNDILCVFKETSGPIWVGTDGAGASCYDPYLVKFNVLTNNQLPTDINIDMVRALSVKGDSIWIGTSGKGLTLLELKDELYKTYKTTNSKIAGDRIMSLFQDKDKLWIGFQFQGLQALDSRGVFLPEKGTLPYYTIWKILAAESDKLWLCTRSNGLILYDKNNGIVKELNKQNSELTTNNIRTLEKDDDDLIWIGTDDDGLFSYNIDNKILTKVNEVPFKIKSLLLKNDLLWVGTNGNGLVLYNTLTKETKVFTEKDGLPNNVIYSILSDKKDNLWLSSNYGITKFKLEDNQVIIDNYNSFDGLQNYEFNTGAYFKATDGAIYFGGLEGINWFYPSQLAFNNEKPKTVITGMQVFDKAQNLVEDLELKHKDNTITFTFSALQFSNPYGNHYKYRLINNDETWIESGNFNKAHYTNLPPDNYEFQVISSNYDGLWNTTPASLKFTILEPWYSTPLAILLYGLFFVLMSLIFYSYLKKRWELKAQLKFEHEETLRLKKLNAYKTKFYNNISHEFRTPLTLISGPVEKLLSIPSISDRHKQDLNFIKRNSRRLLNLVNQLLDLSKLETGNLKLAVSRGNLSILLKQLVEAFKFKAQENNITLNHSIDELSDVWFDRDVIEKIVANLLSNAVKYTPENGYIYFNAHLNADHLTISVLNNGNNLKANELSNLFLRYYQKNKNNEGVGIGLSLVKELATLSHGNVVAHTLNNDEIQFVVSLPIKRSYFNASEIEENIEIHSSIPSEVYSNAPNNLRKPLGEKQTLLIVEDDKDIRGFVKSIFKDLFTILEAKNGKDGITKANKEIPDIIISDVMMPFCTGIELCNTLKNDFKTSHIPIILLTAKSGDLNEIEGIKTGADAYITKPFNSDKLKLKVEKLIENRKRLQVYYSKNSTADITKISLSKIDKPFFQKLKTVIEDNISQSNFSADNLSKGVGLSRMQLHRKIKAITGLSTSEFIRNERLKLAAELLKSSDNTISEIAYQTGFSSPSYFIKCFKDIYKCTPKEFKKDI